MITLISTPDYHDPADATIVCRWLATESPNNFRLLRRDWLVAGANAGGFLQLTCGTLYTGDVTHDIACYDATTDSMYLGKVTAIGGGLLVVTTDIPWLAAMNITYMNDNTLHGGYYFEGRLTVKVMPTLT